jgi:hypothetical protein
MNKEVITLDLVIRVNPRSSTANSPYLRSEWLKEMI